MAKKILLFLALGILVLGAGAWAGLTWLFGTGAEAALSGTEFGREEDGESVEYFLAVNDGFERGFLSSRAETHLGLPGAADDDGDGVPDEGVILRHEIYHGPIAFTPDGVIPCSNHVITRLDLDRLPGESGVELEELFGASGPLIIRTTSGVDRKVTSRIEIPSFSHRDDRQGGTIDFDGLQAEFTFVGGEDRIQSLEGEANLGAWKIQFEGETIEGTPGNAQIDFHDEQKLKGHLTLGEITGENQSVEWALDSMTLTFDLVQAGESAPLFVGDSRLGFDELRLAIAGELLSVENGEVLVKSGHHDGLMHGSIRYGVGGLAIPPAFAGPALPFLPALEKGLFLEIGGRGIDMPGLEEMIRKAQDMQSVQVRLLAEGGPGNPAELASDEEYQAAVEDYLESFMGLVRPGAELYQRLEFRGASGDSHAQVELGLVGDRSLVEMGTLRDLLGSMAGEASIKISKADLPPEQLAQVTGGLTASGFLREMPTVITGDATLTDGIIHLNGQPTPILDALGPRLDEPIPWEEIMAGAVIGAAASGAP